MIIYIALVIILFVVVLWFTPRQEHYFDAAATTRMSKKVSNILAMRLEDEHYVDWAKTIVKLTVGDEYKVIFNSGASEGNNYVFRTLVDHCRKYEPGLIPHVVCSTIEHKSVLMCIQDLVDMGLISVTFVKPNCDGIIDSVEIAKAVNSSTRLISVMHVNNEIGSISDIYEISKVARKYGVLFHSDCTQSFCKLDIKGPDIITASAHKIHGPKGVGILCLGPRVSWTSSQIAGTQQDGLRGGTENISGITATGFAILETSYDRWKKDRKLMEYKRQIINKLPVRPVGDIKHTIPGILAITMDDVCNLSLKRYLLENNIKTSVGSACNKDKPSYVAREIGSPPYIRISMPDDVTQKNVNALINTIDQYYNTR